MFFIYLTLAAHEMINRPILWNCFSLLLYFPVQNMRQTSAANQPHQQSASMFVYSELTFGYLSV